VEVYEALPSQPWPARFAAREQNGRIVMTVPPAAVTSSTRDALEACYHAAGIAVSVQLADGDVSGRHLRTTRADLLETTFSREEQ